MLIGQSREHLIIHAVILITVIQFIGRYCFINKLPIFFEIFCIGDTPFSEPETIILGQLMQNLKPKMYVNLHTYSQVILTPWGYTSRKPPTYPEIVSLLNLKLIYNFYFELIYNIFLKFYM